MKDKNPNNGDPYRQAGDPQAGLTENMSLENMLKRIEAEGKTAIDISSYAKGDTLSKFTQLITDGADAENFCLCSETTGILRCDRTLTQLGSEENIYVYTNEATSSIVIIVFNKKKEEAVIRNFRK